MRQVTFTVPTDIPSYRTKEQVKDYLRALQPQFGKQWGDNGKAVGIGFVWLTKKTAPRNVVLRYVAGYLVNALVAVRVLSPDGKKYIYNLEQRIKPAYGAQPCGTVILREE